VVVSIDGCLTFMASARLDAIRGQLDRCPTGQEVVLDLSGLTVLDASGGAQLLEILEGLERRGIPFVLKGFSGEALATLRALDPAGLLANRCTPAAGEVLARLQDGAPGLGRDRLVYGVQRFRRTLRPSYLDLFHGLAGGQSPHTLFITCCDSRINPNLMTSTDPGELFVIRVLGNLVPPFGQDGGAAEAAGIEYAVGVLGVKEIVLCGHSDCGAMRALVAGQTSARGGEDSLPCLAQWLENARGVRQRLPAAATPDQAAQANLVLQMENLKGYPVVCGRLVRGTLRIHGWYYDIAEAELSRWDERSGRLVDLVPELAEAR
jgi:carbonic anhydrase